MGTYIRYIFFVGCLISFYSSVTSSFTIGIASSFCLPFMKSLLIFWTCDLWFYVFQSLSWWVIDVTLYSAGHFWNQANIFVLLYIYWGSITKKSWNKLMDNFLMMFQYFILFILVHLFFQLFRICLVMEICDPFSSN